MLEVLRAFLRRLFNSSPNNHNRAPLGTNGSQIELRKDSKATENSDGRGRTDLITSDRTSTTPVQGLVYDKTLLERSYTQWQLSDWISLCQLNEELIQGHPDRGKLALIAAAGHLQAGRHQEAERLIELAQGWEASKELISQILISDVHNSLGRAAAIAKQPERSEQHFQSAIVIGSPGADAKLLKEARIRMKLEQLGSKVADGLVPISDQRAHENKPFTQEPTDESEPATDKAFDSFSSAQYWKDRYLKGGNSGYGSYGRLADFKANIINKFISDESIEDAIEFGCGDGNQLKLIKIKSYIGVDISKTIIDKCKLIFQDDVTKSFYVNEDFNQNPSTATLTLSLDVIFHLIEDEVFEHYIHTLFEAAERYCIIYACNEESLESDAVHVRRRKFTHWIEDNVKNWRLMQVIYNKYPHDGSRNPKDLSFSNFYFYERV